MSIDIRMEGFDDVLKKLNNMGERNLERTLGQCCALVEKAAKEKAPKDNGVLRRSITSKVEDKKGIIFTPLEYAPYVEYGTGLFAEEGGRKDVPWVYKDDEGEWHSTSGQHPQPFMRPALNENRQEIMKIIQRGLSNK